jgi:hypothetical protein
MCLHLALPSQAACSVDTIARNPEHEKEQVGGRRLAAAASVRRAKGSRAPPTHLAAAVCVAACTARST